MKQADNHGIVIEELVKEYVTADHKKKSYSFIPPFIHRGKKTVKALDRFSLSVKEGELLALLGPNGAGKTTLIKILCTLLEPTSGRVLLNGFDVAADPDRVRSSLGVVIGGERAVYWKLTARENLKYFASLYHVPPPVAKERMNNLLALVGLTDRADDRVESYSTGMRQRLLVAKSFINDPLIILFDEPTAGLDVQSARHIRKFILDQKKTGKTMIFATHTMEEADQLADRVAVIHKGNLVALDSPEELKHKICPETIVHVELTPETGYDLDSFKQIPGVNRVIKVDGEDSLEKITLFVGGSPARLARKMVQMLPDIANFRFERPTLEDVFIKLTGEGLTD
ncbi:MAG: ABC transporter ATP-binding protein [bacterium]|jgi:ABC-2 type transport system ATP-binding protein|nr:ABC transporter ATP-binding protein [bacterium]